MTTNPKFEEFRAALEQAGVTLRLTFDATTAGAGSRGRRDVVGYACVGNGFTPAVTTIVVRLHANPRDGFAIWFEDSSMRIADCVAAIVGERA